MKVGIIIGGILILIVGFFAISSPATDNSESANNTVAASYVPLESELYIGSQDAEATIIEYADFKCPSCGQFHQTTSEELQKAYPTSLKIAFRPIAVIGPDSERAAVGAYCAADQNQFKAYHDNVFDYMWENYYAARNYAAEFEDILTARVLGEVAQESNLNTEQFVSCLEDPAHASLVDRNLQSAQTAGVRGTPTFVVNGQNITGPQPFNVFKPLIEIQL